MTAKPKLSIVIPFRNEGLEPYKTLESILRTSKDVEVIFVEDGPHTYSFVPYAKNYSLGYQHGTCYARDYGVSKANSDNILMIDAHMRFRADNWVDKIVEKLEAEPKTIFCTRLKGLNEDGSENGKYYQGATVQMYAEKEIIAEKWAKFTPGDFPEIPIIMGGNYCFRKEWYEKIRGLQGLKMFGNIQSYISFKSWIFGGKVKCLNTVEIAHIFKTRSPHRIPLFYSYYNRLYIMFVLFPKDLRKKCISYLDNDKNWQKAWGLINKNIDQIRKDKEFYKKNSIVDIRTIFDNFDIKY